MLYTIPQVSNFLYAMGIFLSSFCSKFIHIEPFLLFPKVLILLFLCFPSFYNTETIVIIIAKYQPNDPPTNTCNTSSIPENPQHHRQTASSRTIWHRPSPIQQPTSQSTHSVSGKFPSSPLVSGKEKSYRPNEMH